jgi:hypothetical protein
MVSLFVSTYKLNDACAKDLLKIFSIVLPQPNKVKRNINKLRFDLNEDTNDNKTEIICEKCWTIKNDYGPCLNTRCSISNKEPNSGEIFYFNVPKQLDQILKREAECLVRYKNVNISSLIPSYFIKVTFKILFQDFNRSKRCYKFLEV